MDDGHTGGPNGEEDALNATFDSNLEIWLLNRLCHMQFMKRAMTGKLSAWLAIDCFPGAYNTSVEGLAYDEAPIQQMNRYSFDDYNNLQPKSFSANWIKGEDAFVYRGEDGVLLKYNCNHRNTTIYRHTAKSKYAIYDTNTRTHKQLTLPGMDDIFQYVDWSPSGHGLVLVQGNNIYYKEDIGDMTTPAIQYTEDGVEGIIYNGIPDWVYEEEVLGTDHALWWSPNGRHILYAHFNDTMVKDYYYPIYGAMDNSYGEAIKLRYPKAGSTNPTFSLNVLNLDTNTNVSIPVPQELVSREYYFTKVEWRDNDYFVVSYLNRPQNISYIYVCNTQGQCRNNQKEEGHGGWVQLVSPPHFTLSGQHYFLVLPRQEGAEGYYKHVAMISLDLTSGIMESSGEGQKVYLTHGSFDVMSIVGYDSQNQTVYYIAAKDPRQRHLYRVSVDSTSPDYKESVCLSCDYDPKCQYVSASFSTNGDYFIMGCLGPGVPYYVLKSTHTNFEHVLEDNAVFKLNISSKHLPTIEYVNIKLPTGESMYGKLLLPPELNKDHVTKYPLLMNVYGGPDTQRVTMRYQLAWETYLASSRGFIIAYADGRGGAARGQRWLQSNYRRLGGIEVEDTITAGEFFKNIPYVDETKMSIWGWSYGGYLTTSVLGRGTETFQCGISVAPVTDWIYYDTIYTERYMGTPHDNAEGYHLGNASRLVEHFKKSKYLLVHGTGDDNVHFQNSAQFIRSLVEGNIYYRTQIYTDKQHSLTGGNTRTHLYTTLEDFLHECNHGYSKYFGYTTESDT
ncbi:hypothetical protein FSP39_022859 [Pinctada imbricata]|uniref:Dipeptidyl peptidase 4 n=1 Tax=Pinctada imbricata TaxID=66713 RepID=A0AA88XF84_PINIB|nr:hypothetical protein FSP39_022859 [Pinctada imbricata]